MVYGKFTHIVWKTFSGILVAAACVMLPASGALSQDLFAGNIKAIESDNPTESVMVLRTGFSGIITGKPGDAVFTGDVIKTGKGVKAQILLSDSTVVVLAPFSTTQIRGHQVDRSQAKRMSVMKTLKGTVRYIVSKLCKPHPAGAEMIWRDSSMTIETVNCIAGVRGTDLIVSVGPDVSEIAVLEGAVSMRGSSSSQHGEVMIGSNQVSSVRKGASPSFPADLSAERRETLVRSTTLMNPRMASNGNGNGAHDKKNGKKYGTKDLSGDLAMGMPLGEVLDKAVKNGMPIEDAVNAAISEAGVAADAAVYTAITEGYPVNKVVESAIKSGAALNTVVSSALAAGGEKKLIILGSQDAGVPPVAIANAFVGTGSPNAPIGGGGGATGGTPPVTIPTPPTPIGGGGGAPASTKKASPYRP